MATSLNDFLLQAQSSVHAGTLTGRSIGEKIVENGLNQRKGGLHQCPFCYTLLIPSLSTIFTVSAKKLKKSKHHLPVVHILQPSLRSKKHFIKVHCKICKKSHIIPCGKKIKHNPSSSNFTPAKVTPKRRRRSCDLKSLFKQTTPQTPSTPSLLDFLY